MAASYERVTVDISRSELALLNALRTEPQLVENMRRATFEKPHERDIHERLRRFLIKASGAQRQARPTRGD